MTLRRSFILELKMLLKTDFRRLYNHVFKDRGHSDTHIFLFIMITLAFVLVEYKIAAYLFNRIMVNQYLEELRFVLLAKIMNMVFLIFFALLMYSNIVMAISSFFVSRELDLLCARPMRKATIFSYRFLESFLASSWMFIAFGIPVFLAYGSIMGHSMLFIWKILVIIIPILLATAGLGVTIAHVLILIFSPRRTHRALVIAGVMLSVGLVLIFRWMRPEQLVSPIGTEQMTFYLSTLRMPTINWLPSTWASEALSAMGEKHIADAIPHLSFLWVTAMACMMMSYLGFRWIWWRARSAGRGAELVDDEKGTRRRKKFRPANRFRMGYYYRDTLLFVRDAGQWSQLIVIAALVVIYIYNFKNLPYELYGFQYSMSFVSVGASGLILSALLARFAFPAVSSEGRAIWLLHSSPVSWRRYLWGKFLTFAIPAAAIGVILVLFSLVILDAPGVLLLKCISIIILIAVGCTALGIGLGARYARYDLSDPARVAVSAGGMLFMVLSFAYIVLLVTLAAAPDIVRYLSLYTPWIRRYLQYDRVFLWAAILLIGSSITYFPIRAGIKVLQR